MSPWFESACKPEWQQNFVKPGTIQLDEVRPSTFSLFVEWLNGRKLVGGDGELYNVELVKKTPSTREQVVKAHAFFREILSLYLFADQYDIPQLRRDIMDICYRYLDLDLFIGTGTGSNYVILAMPALITAIFFIIDHLNHRCNRGRLWIEIYPHTKHFPDLALSYTGV
jgi:hypothetical protein